MLPLKSFDPFIQWEKSRGYRENDLENRFQEDLWDTVLHTFALFPAWSDMKWNVPQYGRNLAKDLKIVQALASSLVGVPVPKTVDEYPTYLAHSSPVVLNYIHHRLDRFRGLQYVANFKLRESRDNKTFNMLVEKSMDDPRCQVWFKESATDETVYILLPYKGREERLSAFVENFRALREESGENVVLIVSCLKTSKYDIEFVNSLKDKLSSTGHESVAKLIWLHENEGDVANGFSRGVALREAAKMAKGDNAVIFQCDVDMILLPTFFDRCRQNTILGSQVYYPVFYSLYPYANFAPQIRQRNGFWRATSFGMTCMRKSDFQRVGAFNDAETRFHGWGSEDVYQFERVRNTTELVAFRAVEPGLMHKWHTKQCDPKSEAYADCMKTNFVTMGHPLNIGPVLLSSLQDVGQFFGKLEHLGTLIK